MPVLEHDIHPSTQAGPDRRYGCWNRADRFLGHYLSLQRHYHGASFEMRVTGVRSVMSDDCRYDGVADPMCEGCRHHLVSPYVKAILENGK